MLSNKVLSLFLISAVWCAILAHHAEGKTRNASAADCPRIKTAVFHRRCMRRCRNDDDCKGKRRVCVCDGDCGMSCIKKARTIRHMEYFHFPMVDTHCGRLDAPKNGRAVMNPDDSFGASATYTCDFGYTLEGNPTRKCEGDRWWSGETPRCVKKVHCGPPPQVTNAMHDAQPQQVVFEVGTRLEYECKTGYFRDGYARALCIGDGRWVGPRIICAPRNCGNPGDLINGQMEGTLFNYPNMVTYKCHPGFQLNDGDSYRYCQADGMWSGRKPRCEALECSRLRPPEFGELVSANFRYNGEVVVKCSIGYRLVGSRLRRCQADQTWSGQEPICQEVDCGSPGILYGGYIEGESTGLGSVITFRCLGKTQMEGPKETTCLDGGTWSHELPKCWRLCAFPSIENGTVWLDGSSDEVWIPHTGSINVTCAEGLYLNTTESPECNNGTFNFLPRCEPRPCEERPPRIPNGRAIYHKRRHGSRAKYKCDSGYNLNSNLELVCSYGKWEGELPRCEPQKCPFPGEMKNGKVLLVGNYGNYDYRPYIPDVGQGRQIKFECNKGFRLNGPLGATCVNGVWSPNYKPECEPDSYQFSSNINVR